MKPEDLTEQLQGIEPENNDDEFNAEKNIIEHEKLYTVSQNAIFMII